MKATTKKEFIAALEQFKAASLNLCQRWIDSDNEILDHAPDRMYPFEKSFDELTTDISLWVNDTIETINRIPDESNN